MDILLFGEKLFAKDGCIFKETVIRKLEFLTGILGGVTSFHMSIKKTILTVPRKPTMARRSKVWKPLKLTFTIEILCKSES